MDFDMVKHEAGSGFVRSAARQKYSRANNGGASYRRRAKPDEARARGALERLILQGTICGGILAFFLLINLVNIRFADNLSGWVSENISHSIIADAPEGLQGITNWVSGFFGGDEIYEYAQGGSDAPPEIDRIDEDLLRRILGDD